MDTSSSLMDIFSSLHSNILLLSSSATSTILWSNSTILINDMPPETFFWETSNTMKKNDLVNLMDSLSIDFGDFSAAYRDSVVRTNPCGGLFFFMPEEIGYCSLIFEGQMKQNMINTLQGMIKVMDDLVLYFTNLPPSENNLEIVLEKESLRDLWVMIGPFSDGLMAL